MLISDISLKTRTTPWIELKLQLTHPSQHWNSRNCLLKQGFPNFFGGYGHSLFFFADPQYKAKNNQNWILIIYGKMYDTG